MKLKIYLLLINSKLQEIEKPFKNVSLPTFQSSSSLQAYYKRQRNYEACSVANTNRVFVEYHYRFVEFTISHVCGHTFTSKQELVLTTTNNNKMQLQSILF